jgi:hypothetical protein
MADQSVAPAVVFEPQYPPPEDLEICPNTEIIPGLRIHFHRGGVSFGLVDPKSPAWSEVCPYEKARALMLAAALEQQGEEEDHDYAASRLTRKGRNAPSRLCGRCLCFRPVAEFLPRGRTCFQCRKPGVEP